MPKQPKPKTKPASRKPCDHEPEMLGSLCRCRKCHTAMPLSSMRKAKPRTMPAKERATKHTAGVSESFAEMAAEITDPAWWATLQLTKGGQPQPKTIGEAHQRIASIFRQAIDMEIARKPKRTDDGLIP